MEEFVPIKNYETYAINKNGDVLDLRSKKLKKQYKNITAGDYLQLSLINENGYKNFRIHRLVAETFIPKIENKLEVDHIDRNRHNNNVNNLRWVNDIEQAENKSVWDKSNTQRKYIILEDVKNKKNPNPSWKITIKNKKLTYVKRFEYASHTLEDIVEIRNKILKENNIPIIN